MSVISREQVRRHLEVASPKGQEVVKPVLSQNEMWYLVERENTQTKKGDNNKVLSILLTEWFLSN